MEQQDGFYRCPKCQMVGPVGELEIHLAERHHGFRPHSCRTCGNHTYHKALILECASLKHNVALWQARDQTKESQIAADLKKCLSHPVVVTEVKPSLPSAAVTVTIAPTGESVLVNADSSTAAHVNNGDSGLGNTIFSSFAPSNNGDSGLVRAHSSSVVQANTGSSDDEMKTEIAFVATAKRARPSTSQIRKRRHTRFREDSTVHTVMICHYTGCGEEVVMRGKQQSSEIKNRHIQECHLGEQTKNIRCPVASCIKAHGKGNFAHMKQLSGHIGNKHGGVDSLKEEERTSYQVSLRRVRDACAELIPTCFPPEAITRDQTRASATSRCAMCGESVKGTLRDLRQIQKKHIETRHVEACNKVNCPIEGCHKTYGNFVCLERHIINCHGGVGCLSEEQLAKHHAVRKRRNAAIDTIFAYYFPD